MTKWTEEMLPKINFGDNKELEEKYKKLTPENKAKCIDYALQLHREQKEQEEAQRRATV